VDQNLSARWASHRRRPLSGTGGGKFVKVFARDFSRRADRADAWEPRFLAKVRQRVPFLIRSDRSLLDASGRSICYNSFGFAQSSARRNNLGRRLRSLRPWVSLSSSSVRWSSSDGRTLPGRKTADIDSVALARFFSHATRPGSCVGGSRTGPRS